MILPSHTRNFRQPSPEPSSRRMAFQKWCGRRTPSMRRVKSSMHAYKSEEVIAMRENGSHKIRVGIIGANPERGWAAQAHIPALKSLSEDFEITALSTTSRESADAAGKFFDVPHAFDN